MTPVSRSNSFSTEFNKFRGRRDSGGEVERRKGGEKERRREEEEERRSGGEQERRRGEEKRRRKIPSQLNSTNFEAGEIKDIK